jgi:NitT/TauT family transport system permease protein
MSPRWESKDDAGSVGTSDAAASRTHRAASAAIRLLVRAYKVRPGVFHGVISLLLAIAVWELMAARLSPVIVPHLDEVWSDFKEMAQSGELWTDVKTTGQTFVIAFVIASVSGIFVGMVMASSRITKDVLEPWVSALYATPTIALAPLFIVTFGIEMSSKIAVGVLLGIFVVIINTEAGIRTADRQLVETAYSFTANRIQIFTKVLLPSAVPFIITGLRLAVGRTLIGVVVAEFFGSRAGLGNMIFTKSQSFQTGAVFAGVFILMAFATLVMKLMYRLERWIAPWRDSEAL